MASNFHNILGFLDIGVDWHKGLQIVPILPGVPFVFPELVCVHPFALGPGWKTKVLINGVPSVVNGHTSLISWPHLPIIPHNATFVSDMLQGEHACWLPRGTVFIQDSTSTCCIAGPVSNNIDCGYVPITNLILQVATVQTTPTLSDFIFGALSVVINKAFGAAQSALFKKWKPLKNLTKKVDGIAHKIAVRATKKGFGYQAAKKLGRPFVKKLPGLSKRALSGRAKTKGRELAEEALKRAGLDAQTPLEMAKKAFDFDPTRPLASVMKRPDSDGNVPGLSPIKGFDPGKGLEGIPLYDKAKGGVQLVTGGG
ncbi:MAG: hypothetical protein ACMG6S_21170 [Byssovorax sp.]